MLALPRLLEGNLGVEPPDHDLGSLQALQGDNLQERDRVAVIPLVHLPHNGQQVPHSLGLTTPQRSQKAGPLCSAGWSRRGKVVDVTEHDWGRHTELGGKNFMRYMVVEVG